jgi:hypothetical protein
MNVPASIALIVPRASAMLRFDVEQREPVPEQGRVARAAQQAFKAGMGKVICNVACAWIRSREACSLAHALFGAGRWCDRRIRLLVSGCELQERRGERRRHISAAPMRTRFTEGAR